jgi:acyl-coenzyme A synthetase/AMP-(fatty) acid ligase
MTPGRFNFTRDVVERADPAKLALRFVDATGGVRDLTFGEVAERAALWTGRLRSCGLEPGERVLVLIGKTPEWHAVMLAALKVGAVAIPCSEMLRAKDLDFRMRHSGAGLLIADPGSRDEIDAMAEAPDVVYVGETELGEPDPATADTAAEDPAFILYTSGTTKDPKAVLHAHAYTFAHRYTGEYWLDLQRSDLHWTTSDTGWAKAAYGVLFGPWMNGVPVLMFDGRFDPARELDLLARYEVSVFCAPPTEYRLLVKEDLRRWHLPRLRHCTGAGEPLNAEAIHAWHDAFGLLVHDGYGQTETMLLAANLPGLPIRPGSMGKPFPGHDLRVIDDDGAEVAAGTVGDLALRGDPPSLFREYWKSPEETAACRRGEWYVTGDRATRDEDGYLWFVGRADDVIISAGYRIGPFEVESALLEHPAVLESAVVASPDPVRGEIVKAFVVLRPGHAAGDALVRELQDHVKGVTAPYKYPRAIEFVESLPKTVSGKIRRVELRERERRKTR